MRHLEVSVRGEGYEGAHDAVPVAQKEEGEEGDEDEEASDPQGRARGLAEDVGEHPFGPLLDLAGQVVALDKGGARLV